MKRTDSKGKLVGTPNYIAPELLRGAADTHRSDLYSLGATLYHLLVGGWMMLFTLPLGALLLVLWLAAPLLWRFWPRRGG